MLFFYIFMEEIDAVDKFVFGGYHYWLCKFTRVWIGQVQPGQNRFFRIHFHYIACTFSPCDRIYADSKSFHCPNHFQRRLFLPARPFWSIQSRWVILRSRSDSFGFLGLPYKNTTFYKCLRP